jgi:uncharacterized membrane protein
MADTARMDIDPGRAPERTGETDWRAAALELVPLAAPFLLIVAGLGIVVAFAGGLGWAKIGRADIGVPYAVVRGAVMAALFLVVIWAVLAHGSDDRRAAIPFGAMAAVWGVPPLISAALVAATPRRTAPSAAASS